VRRSFRNRGTEASETKVLSSSLSSHAAGSLDRNVSSSSESVCVVGGMASASPVSVKKSCPSQPFTPLLRVENSLTYICIVEPPQSSVVVRALFDPLV